jgi:NAD(P)-dependent dehydrogenase (short-subunit alcohol dehydrogenase family)
LIAVNLTGVKNCLRAQLKHIRRPGGAIVNVSSALGLLGLDKHAAYSAAKHGVNGLTKSTAADFGKEGIRVNSVCPYSAFFKF